MNHSCSVDPEDLGPYVLGQLDPRREEEVAGAVASCPSCTEQVARLGPVVAAMAAGSPPPDAPPVDGADRTPPPGGLDRVLASVHREDRIAVRRPVRTRPAVRRTGGRRRLVAALATAAVLLVAVLGGIVAVTTLRPDPGRQVALTGTAGASASVVLQERSWGTAIDLEVAGLDPGTTYGVWLERREGGRLGAGSFRPAADGSLSLSLSSALALDESGAVGIARLPNGSASEAVDVLSARLD